MAGSSPDKGPKIRKGAQAPDRVWEPLGGTPNIAPGGIDIPDALCYNGPTTNFFNHENS